MPVTLHLSYAPLFAMLRGSDAVSVIGAVWLHASPLSPGDRASSLIKPNPSCHLTGQCPSHLGAATRVRLDLPHSSRAAPCPLAPCRRGLGSGSTGTRRIARSLSHVARFVLTLFPLQFPHSPYPSSLALTKHSHFHTTNSLFLPASVPCLLLPASNASSYLPSTDLGHHRLTAFVLLTPPLPERTGFRCIRPILACLSPGGTQVRTRPAVHPQGTCSLVAPTIDNQRHKDDASEGEKERR